MVGLSFCFLGLAGRLSCVRRGSCGASFSSPRSLCRRFHDTLRSPGRSPSSWSGYPGRSRIPVRISTAGPHGICPGLGASGHSAAGFNQRLARFRWNSCTYCKSRPSQISCAFRTCPTGYVRCSGFRHEPRPAGKGSQPRWDGSLRNYHARRTSCIGEVPWPQSIVRERGRRRHRGSRGRRSRGWKCHGAGRHAADKAGEVPCQHASINGGRTCYPVSQTDPSQVRRRLPEHGSSIAAAWDTILQPSR